MTSAASLTNAVLAGTGINEQGSFDLAPSLGEPFVPSRAPWLADAMSVDGAGSPSFVDSDDIQVQRDVLYHKLDLLLRANIRSSPVYFGVDREIKFVEHHDYQPGIPTPVGISFRRRNQSFAFFAELAPILEFAPASVLGLGGGVGIRFYFDR
jgi:hypothetical protein